MSYSIGFDPNWRRDVGYGVPAFCDHPECDNEIDRGFSYVCGGDFYGGEHGCGLFFCGIHLGYSYTEDGMDDLRDENGECYPARCERCVNGQDSFSRKGEHPRWMNWKLTDPSWGNWRSQDPDTVAEWIAILAAQGITPAPEVA